MCVIWIRYHCLAMSAPRNRTVDVVSSVWNWVSTQHFEHPNVIFQGPAKQESDVEWCYWLCGRLWYDTNRTTIARLLADPNYTHNNLPRHFGLHMIILFNVNVRILVLVKWSCRSPPPKKKLMVTVEPRIVNIVWAHSPVSFERVFFDDYS